MALMSNAATRVEIVVTKGMGGGGESVALASDKSPVEAAKERKTAKQKEDERQARVKARANRLLMRHMIGGAIQITSQTTNYLVSGIGASSGDSAYQDYMQREVEKVMDITGIVSSGAMSFGSGLAISGGNVVFAAANMAVTSMSTLTSKYFKYMARYREYNYKTFKENNAIEYNRSRANINLTTGRLR